MLKDIGSLKLGLIGGQQRTQESRKKNKNKRNASKDTEVNTNKRKVDQLAQAQQPPNAKDNSLFSASWHQLVQSSESSEELVRIINCAYFNFSSDCCI